MRRTKRIISEEDEKEIREEKKNYFRKNIWFDYVNFILIKI